MQEIPNQAACGHEARELVAGYDQPWLLVRALTAVPLNSPLEWKVIVADRAGSELRAGALSVSAFGAGSGIVGQRLISPFIQLVQQVIPLVYQHAGTITQQVVVAEVSDHILHPLAFPQYALLLLGNEVRVEAHFGRRPSWRRWWVTVGRVVPLSQPGGDWLPLKGAELLICGKQGLGTQRRLAWALTSVGRRFHPVTCKVRWATTCSNLLTWPVASMRRS
jgi:hypothetical protein